MSKRKPTTDASMREYAAEYAAAEERLLNIFSPLNSPQSEITSANVPNDTSAASADTIQVSLYGADPSTDNMLPYISDDIDIHSLLASSDSSPFRGFDDDLQDDVHAPTNQTDLVFGISRNITNVQLLDAQHLLGCSTPKRVLLSPSVAGSPMALLEAGSSASGYMHITNGNLSGSESVPSHEQQQQQEQQLDVNCQNVMDEGHEECVIYEDDDNVVILNDDEIIVEQDIEHSYLMGLQHAAQESEQLNNGASYGSEQELEHIGEPHVYLSDAALDHHQQQHHHHHHPHYEQHHQHLVQQQQLPLDVAEEEAIQECDDFVDEQQPDICEVYDHELEEHDPDEQDGSLQLPTQQQQQVAMEQLEIRSDHHLLEEAAAVEEEVAATAATAPAPHSSTTEFPVSSTSMPNGSDYDDYDDELGTADDQAAPPVMRKYMPLLKNTLSADALDRRLAHLCQSQPQMSLSEKLANWDCSTTCEAVEDVEGFDAEFAAHMAERTNQIKFEEFYQNRCKSRTKPRQESGGETMEANVTPDTPYSSEEAATQKRPSYRRLLPVIPPPVEHIELIDLDDDDDDDDCYEVMVNPSTETLVPDHEGEQPEQEPIVKTMHTQTRFSLPLNTKLTSTTDLSQQDAPPIRQVCLEQEEDSQPEDSNDVSQAYNEQDEREEQRQHQVCSIGVECNSDPQFFEQHEFCNYLGLTELATANAVVTAMRELASSNLARRTLRVRTQQQLERMRSDVRGKRRERKQRDQLPQEENMAGGQELSDTSSIISNTSSKKSHSPMRNLSALDTLSAAPPSINTNFVYPRPSTISTMPDTAPTNEFYYSVPHDDSTMQSSHPMTVNDFHTMSLDAAFAQVYAAAAPAASEIHAMMQERLRQARQAQPAIYIVKAVNNDMQNSISQPAVQVSTPHVVPEPRPQYNNNKLPEPPSPAKATRKTQKKVSPTKSTKRRRTTGNAITGQSDRDLVTRSTTHMNSKLLRNRKVSLLKSYELSNAATNGRSKHRLSGGSQAAVKRLNNTTPKVDKPNVVEKKIAAPSEQSVICHPPPTEQHRLEQQQQLRTPSPKLNKKTKSTKTQQQPEEGQQKGGAKRKRLRTKSLPTTLPVGDSNVVPLTPEESPMKQQPSMQLKDTAQEFLAQQNMISPPQYSAAVRRYVNAVCKPNELHSEQQQQQQQLQQNDNAFYELSASYAQLAKPSLIQYPPLSPPTSQRAPHFSRRVRQVAGTTSNVPTNVKITPPGGLYSMSKGSVAMRNPLAGKNGKVLYMYYELDQLIVLQEKLVSFWKYSTIFNVLRKATPEASNAAAANQQHAFNVFATNTNSPNSTQNTNPSPRKTSTDTNNSDDSDSQRWDYLGGTRRITNDIEVSTPHNNRLCIHNSTPVYIEMRSHPLDHHKRESKLLSLYVNVYYYCDEEQRPKMHSVHLDAVNCDPSEVIYTSIVESRYFVMACQQELVLGKPRAGICKYSLTPTLDTLASIREFKQMRHVLNHIECLTEDRLIGYGQTRITIWDHRSGDTLMNYDFGFELGLNLGVVHFPSFDMDLSSMLVLYQHVKEANNWPELRIIACELSHATPSHRLLHVHHLPSPQFDSQLVAINTGDHLILRAPTDDEIWISTSDPCQLTYVAPQNTQRFYTRQKSQIITMTSTTLAVDSIANHVLKLATGHQEKILMSTSQPPLPVAV